MVGPGRASLPIACTLAPADVATRARRWQALHERAEPRAEVTPGRLEFRYPPEAGVRDDLLELADAERACCAFVSWEVLAGDEGPVLRVMGPPDGVLAVAAMFGVEDPSQSTVPR